MQKNWDIELFGPDLYTVLKKQKLFGQDTHTMIRIGRDSIEPFLYDLVRTDGIKDLIFDVVNGDVVIGRNVDGKVVPLIGISLDLYVNPAGMGVIAVLITLLSLLVLNRLKAIKVGKIKVCPFKRGFKMTPRAVVPLRKQAELLLHVIEEKESVKYEKERKVLTMIIGQLH
ncbi:MAG: hypothetical protein AAB705_04045 [Patescibacteria group bacterium]